LEKLVQDQVVFITGAASGIGKELASAFAAEGARVVLCDLNKEAAEKEAVALRNLGHTAISIGCDVTDEKALCQGIDETLAKFGKLDILINNAGLQFDSPIEY
jgi:3-hydroxybutyrate dehydrogenase